MKGAPSFFSKITRRKPKLKFAIIQLYIFLFLKSVQAQQPFVYTQYIDNLTPINPAYCMVAQGSMVNFLARKQWVGIEGSPSTFLLNGYMHIPTIAGGAGIIAVNDKIGVESLTEVNAFFVKSIQLSYDTYLSASVNGGFRYYQALYAQLDPNDPILFNNNVRETVGNMGIGAITYDPQKFYAGVSIPRLSFRDLGRGSIETSRHLKNTYYLTAGFLFLLENDFMLKASTLVGYSANLPMQMDLAAKLIYRKGFGFGLNYRTNNQLAALFSANVHHVHIGYSYQFGFGPARLGNVSNGTHEATLAVYFDDVAKPLFE